MYKQLGNLRITKNTDKPKQKTVRICTGIMIPLRRGVRGADRGPFSSLPFSYFLLQTYCKSSFKDCNSLPEILERIPRKSCCERPQTTFLPLVTRNPSQIKH